MLTNIFTSIATEYSKYEGSMKIDAYVLTLPHCRLINFQVKAPAFDNFAFYESTAAIMLMQTLVATQ